MLEALDHFVSEPSYQGQGGIAERSEYFRRMTRAGTRLIFATADITYVMKAILDAPVRPGQSEQLFCPGAGSGETGNCVDGLDGFLAAHDTLARDAADLRDARPQRAQISSQGRGGFQPPGLDPSVAFLDRFGDL